MTLPDCMMPDGAEPCKGYQELQKQLDLSAKAWKVWEATLKERDAEIAQLKAELKKVWEAALKQRDAELKQR
jgi:hypothetical protein